MSGSDLSYLHFLFLFNEGVSMHIFISVHYFSNRYAQVVQEEKHRKTKESLYQYHYVMH